MILEVSRIVSRLFIVHHIAIISHFGTLIFLNFILGRYFVSYMQNLTNTKQIFEHVSKRLSPFTYRFLQPTMIETPKWRRPFLSRFMRVLCALLAWKVISNIAMRLIHIGKWDLKYWAACRNQSKTDRISTDNYVQIDNSRVSHKSLFEASYLKKIIKLRKKLFKKKRLLILFNSNYNPLVF